MRNLKQLVIGLLFLILHFGSRAQCIINPPLGYTFNTPVASVLDFQTAMNGAFGATTVTNVGTVYTITGFTLPIVFNDVFTVDATLNIVNCPNVTFGANGAIKLFGTSITLNIDNSTLRACGNNLWKGINAYYGTSNHFALGALIQTQHNAIIQDAVYAIDIDNATVAGANLNTLNINQTTFDKNYIGIKVNSTVGSSGIIKGSTFKCSATLLPPYSGQYTYAGVASNFCYTFVLGDVNDPINVNVFDGIACGYYSYGSPVSSYIYSSTFKNIQQYASTPLSASPPENAAGSAIFHRGYFNLFGGVPDDPNQNAVTDLKVFSTCRFYDSYRGIEAHNTHATIDGVQMGGNMQYGILVQNCNQANVTIQSNILDGVKYGMYFGLNNNSNITVGGATSAYKNTIGLPNPYGASSAYYGIRVVDWPTYNAHYTIRSNEITSGTTGIRIENTNVTTTVQHNTITQQNTNGSSILVANIRGIDVANCNSSNVVENVITGYTGVWNLYYHHTGIYLSNSPNMVVRCNQVQTTGYGIWANGDNAAANKMENNTMNNHYYGIYLNKLSSAYGKVGDQGSSTKFNSNLFNGTYTGTYKTFNQTDASQNPSLTDKFWYDASHSGMYSPPSFSNSSPLGRPVQSALIPGSYSVPSSCPVYMMMMGGGGGFSSPSTPTIEIDEALAVAEETKTYTEFPEVSKWLDERKLYDALDESTTNVPVLENFYDDKSTESVGMFKEYNNTLKELAQITDSGTYYQQLEVAKQKNNEVPAAHVYEQNEKDMNSIFLNNLLTKRYDKFDAAQTNRILALAQSCPFVDGKAVYLARALYSLIEPSVIFDDAPICEAMGVYKKERDNNTIDTRREKYAFITPNPTHNIANLFLNLDDQETGELILRDLLGNTVLKYALLADKTFQEINLESVGSGTYLYTVQTDKGFKNTGKLVVIK